MDTLEFFRHRIKHFGSSANVALFNALFPEQAINVNFSNRKLIEYLVKNNYKEIEFPEIDIIDNVLETMDTLNRMVKDPNCPRNLRNRFYAQKHKIIMKLFDRGDIEKISYNKPCYLFYVKGYSFHQPEDRCHYIHHKDYKIEDIGPYECTTTALPFDLAFYNKWYIYYNLCGSAAGIVRYIQ